MLSLIDVNKKYGKNTINAVDHLSFHLGEGEVLGLIGPNGAGKSTTVSMIATLLKPDDGTILFMDQDIVKNPKAIRKRLGYVPQNIALYETLSGNDNLRFWAKAYHVQNEEYVAQYKKVCDIIGFTEEMLNKKVIEYSGGMKRRLNIAVALMHNPKLVILDEPTAGIDIQSRNMILEAIKELSRERVSVLYVGHYMEEVERVCSRICMLNHGKCVLDGELSELLNQDDKSPNTLEQLYEEYCI